MTTADPPAAIAPSQLTRLLSGRLEDFTRYSGQRSHWLMDVAHDICDPAEKRGTLKAWDAVQETWRTVDLNNPLSASRYLYDVGIGVTVSLSKISLRTGMSVTDSSGSISAMKERVHGRDLGRCWVSGDIYELTNSHVCPKRMGHHLFRTIYRTFVSPPPPALSINDERCGITLNPLLDRLFDKYEFGLRLVAQVSISTFLIFVIDS